MGDNLGDRMKGYENISRIYLTKRTPVIIRIDGKAFHTFTRGFVRPFDSILMDAMQKTAEYLCKNITGCKLAYVQSDEISLLLTDYDTISTQPWFDNNLQKLVSIASSMATLEFNRVFSRTVREISEGYVWRPVSTAALWGKRDDKNWEAYSKSIRTGAMFDARAFILPKEEVRNYFIWRQQDATRNSIQMVGRANFSDKQLHKKSCAMIQDMLMLEKGINWNDILTDCKRGACVVTTATEAGKQWVIDREIPIFTQDRNYIESRVYLEVGIDEEDTNPEA